MFQVNAIMENQCDFALQDGFSGLLKVCGRTKNYSDLFLQDGSDG